MAFMTPLMPRLQMLGGRPYNPASLSPPPAQAPVPPAAGPLAQALAGAGVRPSIGQTPQNDMLAKALLSQGNSGEPIRSPLELAGRLAQVGAGNYAENKYQTNQKQQQLDSYHSLADALSGGSADWASVLKTTNDPQVAQFALQQLAKGPGDVKAPAIQEFFDEKTGQPYKAQFDAKSGQWVRVGGVQQSTSGTGPTLTDIANPNDPNGPPVKAWVYPDGRPPVIAGNVPPPAASTATPYTDIGKIEADLKAGRITPDEANAAKAKLSSAGFSQITDPAERAAAGIDPADKGVYQKDNATGRIYSVGNSGGLLGNTNSDLVTQLADGVESGNVPPDMKSFYKYKAPVTAELQKRGVNLSELATDWGATQRHYASLNSTNQTRLRQNISTVKGTLSTVRQLGEEWNANGFPLLNAATRTLAEQGTLGPEANRIVTLLSAQIADVTGEMGSVLMGGNSPTDHAMELAAKNLSADWSYPTLMAALDQFEKNIAFRENAIATVGTAGVANSVFNYDQPSGAPGGPTSLAPAATAPGNNAPPPVHAPTAAPATTEWKEGDVVVNPATHERMMLRGGQWITVK